MALRSAQDYYDAAMRFRLQQLIAEGVISPADAQQLATAAGRRRRSTGQGMLPAGGIFRPHQDTIDAGGTPAPGGGGGGPGIPPGDIGSDDVVEVVDWQHPGTPGPGSPLETPVSLAPPPGSLAPGLPTLPPGGPPPPPPPPGQLELENAGQVVQLAVPGQGAIDGAYTEARQMEDYVQLVIDRGAFYDFSDNFAGGIGFWTQHRGTWAAGAGTAQQTAGAGGTPQTVLLYSGYALYTEASAQIAIVNIAQREAGVYVRYDTAANTGYFARLNAFANFVQLYRVDGVGVLTLIQQAAAFIGNGDTIRLWAHNLPAGTELRVYRNGVLLFSPTDNTYAIGSCGIGNNMNIVTDYDNAVILDRPAA